jgi:hypothetical protein
MQKQKPTSKLPNMPQNATKPKSYPLVGDVVEMADELNKIERSRPKGYRDGPVFPAPKGRDMPLPSSDGIMGKITNWFNKK